MSTVRKTGTLVLLAAMSGAVQAQQSLPAIVGTTLSGTDTFQSDISIDGESIDVTGFYRGGFLADADGDGIAEAYLRTMEPGQLCQTLIYLPSRQSRSVAISSDALDAYTRVRNFGAVLDEFGQVQCPDSSARLRNVGDLNGDGMDDISTEYAYNGEIIFDGAVSNGTLIDATNPLPGQVMLVADDLEVNPIGDVNGDGLMDLSVYSYADDATELNDKHLILASQPGALRPSLDADVIAGDTPLAELPRGEFGTLPRFHSVGDVNADGFDDLAIHEDGEQWLVHGKAQLALDDDYRNNGYRIFDTCSYGGCQRILDFDADGYDDVLMRVSGVDHDSLLDGTGSLIVYGGPDGLLPADEIDTLPEGRVSQIVQKYARPKAGNPGVVQPLSTGDINGDGASDLLLANAIGSYELGASILFGTPGERPAVLIEASIDGSNGIHWVESNAFYGNPGPGDVNGDGIDELAYIDTFIPGSAVQRRDADPQSVFIFNGPDSLDIHWRAPPVMDEISTYRILRNDTEEARLSTDSTSLRIPRVATAEAEQIRIQSLDAAGNVLGEAIRSMTLQDPELVAERERLTDVEFTATGDRIDAEAYNLTSRIYGPSLGELFWNTTKRFVLIWHDGQIIDRVEGNSYMVTEMGEYFITIDYLGDVPDADMGDVLSSGTLHRSNLTRLSQAAPGDPSSPSRPVSDPLPAAPANLTAQVYSASTAELFWDRASAGSGITSHEIHRDGVQIGRSTGISYLDNSRESELNHVYEVIAINRDGLRSSASSVTTAAFHSGGSDDETSQPTAANSLPLTGQVYSSTAVELFWRGDNVNGNTPSSYELRQDGVLVYTANGRSYFTADLAGNTAYRYQLIGLDAAGNAVAQSDEVTLTTHGQRTPADMNTSAMHVSVSGSSHTPRS